MTRAERSDKGRNRVVYVEAPCAGCGIPVRRRASEMRDTMFHSRECFQDYMERALERLRQYELLYGPLPNEQPAKSGIDFES